MRGFIVGLVLVLVACGDSVGPTPDPIPPNLRPGDGVLRFTLGTNCPTLTVLFGVDQFLYGPEELAPGESMDYQEPARVYVTSGRAFPTATRTFASENTTVVAGQRVTRVLAC